MQSPLGVISQTVATILILLGPPGAGKSTQAQLLAQAYGLVIVASGDLLRVEAARPTPLGRRIAEAQARGQLVADDVVNQLVVRRLGAPDCTRGFILDGYPRTIAQARLLDHWLSERRLPAPVVLHLDVPTGILLARLHERGRSDDSPAALTQRLRAYDAELGPLVGYYASRGYHRIRGDQSREAVFADIAAVLSAVTPLDE